MRLGLLAKRCTTHLHDELGLRLVVLKHSLWCTLAQGRVAGLVGLRQWHEKLNIVNSKMSFARYCTIKAVHSLPAALCAGRACFSQLRKHLKHRPWCSYVLPAAKQRVIYCSCGPEAACASKLSTSVQCLAFLSSLTAAQAGSSVLRKDRR